MRIEASWLTTGAAPRIMARLNASGARAFYVGGCVRNALLDRPVFDIDIATDAPPEFVMTRAETAGFKAIPTGIAYGTVTIVVDHQPFEVTTFRKDIETFGRHATVVFTDDIVLDARRRDFTMNALYAAPDGTVLDPVGGLPDLEARLVRFVGEPGERIAEDYLRILRFFRFHAWYGNADAGLDARSLAACAAASSGLGQIARERIGAETTKLLGAPNPSPALVAMSDAGVLERILPGADAGDIASLSLIEAGLGAAPRWHRRLAALGWRDDWVDALRLSRSDRRMLGATKSSLDEGHPPAEAAYRYGVDAAFDAALIRAARSGQPLPVDLKADLRRGSAAAFPVRAADLDLQGRELGDALEALEARWVASDFRLDRASLLAALNPPGSDGGQMP